LVRSSVANVDSRLRARSTRSRRINDMARGAERDSRCDDYCDATHGAVMAPIRCRDPVP